ncbi:hypothetical protein BASA81_000845 [Batrachochytrium salamandrivorans]|nr:hypothetical protein BASA81_000845 [Batrachochytrium salamandrivorans]
MVLPKATASALAFGLLYATYVVAYFCRRNYGFFLNGILQRGDLDSTSAAVFGSTMEIAYGVGKLVAGPVCDNFKPKPLLILSLLVAALCNALMFQFGLYYLDVALWGMNGIAQAFIWPAMALVFFNWFGQSKARGTLYAVLSTNQNLGSALTPVLLTPLVGEFGWRVALWGPALVGAGFCLVLLVLLRESPSVAVVKKEEEGSKPAAEKKAEDVGYVQAVKQMLREKEIWCLGLAYALLTLVRVGMADWGLVILREHLNLGSEYRARDCLVALEMGGFVGGLAAGVVSDSVFRGNRVIVMVLFTLLASAPGVFMVFSLPEYTEAAYLLFGFGSFGPHVLVGLLAREMFPRASSTAGTFAKSLAQVGGAIAGVPISLISTQYGWGAVGMVWTACLVASSAVFSVLLLPHTDSTKSKVE